MPGPRIISFYAPRKHFVLNEQSVIQSTYKNGLSRMLRNQDQAELKIKLSYYRTGPVWTGSGQPQACDYVGTCTAELMENSRDWSRGLCPQPVTGRTDPGENSLTNLRNISPTPGILFFFF
jgi:hypothetical protein